MTRVYMKCSFDCFVSIDEEWMKEKFSGGGVFVISNLVGTLLTNAVVEFNGKSKADYIKIAEKGEMATKYISERQGRKRFEGDNKK